MSASSPFRTDGDKSYRWPPEPGEIESEYIRVTKLLSTGEPQQKWLRSYLPKQIVEFVLDNRDILARTLSTPLEDNFFAVDENWWINELETAMRLDALAREDNKDRQGTKQKPLKCDRMDELMNLTSYEAVVKYLKALPNLHMNVAAKLGTTVHKYAEDISRGLDVIAPKEHWSFLEHIYAFHNDFPLEFLEIESVVYSDKYGYAGQFDFLAKTEDGRIILGDYKTSEKGIKESIALQFAAYAGADFIGRVDGTKDPIPRIDEYWGINLRPDKYAVVPVTVNQETWNHFLAVRETAHWINKNKSEILGRPLKPIKKAA